jgi:arylsulfatase A-like enzyme
MRTGLTTVGMPGALQGIQAEDPTLADLLKPAGLYDAQIGKNHLGDSTEPQSIRLQWRKGEDEDDRLAALRAPRRLRAAPR